MPNNTLTLKWKQHFNFKMETELYNKQTKDGQEM